MNWPWSRRDPITVRAKTLIDEAEAMVVRGKPLAGERKRSYVYNRLVAEFPDAKKRDIGLLIETVLHG